MPVAGSQYAWTVPGEHGKEARPPSPHKEISKSTLTSTGSSAQEVAPKKGNSVNAARVSFVDGEQFSTVMALIVITNVALLSLETDSPDSADIFQRINEAFLLVYLMELVLRFLAHGLQALQDRLTVLDIILVVWAFIDRIASERGLARALPVFRLSRLLRLLRLRRSFRNARELNVLVVNGYKALMTFLWVVLILCVILWGAGTATKVVIGESAMWNGSMDPLIEHEPFTSFDNQEYFGSVSKSILTLLQLVTLSQWADNVARPVVQVYPILFVFFAFFLFATTYGVVMCVVSIIVQDAIVVSRRAQIAVKEAEREERKMTGMRIKKIFACIDENGDGELSVHEIREALQTTDLEVILRDLQVPVLDAESLVRLFDRGGDGYVNQEEFVGGIISMSEDIQPRDFVKLSIWAWNLMMRAQKLQVKLGQLQEQLLRLRQKLEIGFAALHHFTNTMEDTNLRYHAVKAIRNAPPDLPLAAASDPLALPDPEIAQEETRGEAGFTKVQMAHGPALKNPRRPRHTGRRWVTVASPFVTIRSSPHITGNHIGALRQGDLIEFEDLEDGPVKPEHLTQHPYLKCWKIGEDGKRGISGYVVGYMPSTGHHFVPFTDEAAACCSDTSPPHVASERQQHNPTLVNPKGVLPPAPLPFHAAKLEAELEEDDEQDRYALEGAMPSPSLLHLKELMT